ncbi:hypothetical protein HA466_0050580 [Hirschfeldia incana]|nr:hypothetical protein HA466_0050580 [Hirschfeldia incana]
MVISDMKSSSCHKRREHNLNKPKLELHTAAKVRGLHTAREGCTIARCESSESPRVQSREYSEALKVKDRSGGFGGFDGETLTTTTNMAEDGGGSGRSLDRDGERAVTIEADEQSEFFKGRKSGRQS